MSTLGERLREALDDAKMNQSDLATEIGVTRATVSDWVTGATKEISGPNLIKASAALRVSPSWLSANEGPKHQQVAAQTRANYGLAPILAWEHATDLPEGDFAFIPRLEIRLSAGNGHEQGTLGLGHQMELELVQAKKLAFRADWIRENHLRPNKLAAMIASGDSGEPRIYDGDALVVDLSQTEIIDGKLYGIWYDGGERVKRLYRLPGGGLLLHSDNADKYPPLTLQPDQAELVRIIGRVVHVSGEGGL